MSSSPGHPSKPTYDDFAEFVTHIEVLTEKTNNNLYQPDYTVPTAVIMGSEENGISTDLLRISDYLAKIPMYGEIESLNVSVSAGILLYEAVRQKMPSK